MSGSRRIALLAVLFAGLVFVGLASLARLETTIVYGPETFSRAKGNPVSETRVIPIAGFAGPFVLHLRNGDQDGMNRVSSANVRLDGKIVVGPAFFSRQASAFSAEVELSVTAPGVLGNDTDQDNDGLAAALVNDVEHGTLTLAANGSFVYVPDAGYLGTDAFTYKANDGQADSNGATGVSR
jgi:hypothetical protein